jgi:hypothetical protein
VACFDLLSPHLEPLISSDSGLAALTMFGAQERIVFTRLKSVFDYIENEKGKKLQFIVFKFRKRCAVGGCSSAYVYKPQRGSSWVSLSYKARTVRHG